MGRSPEMDMRPQPRGPAAPRRMLSRGRARPRAGVEDVAGELLEQVGLRRIDAEVPQLHLRLGPGQRRARVCALAIAMLVDRCSSSCARSLRDAGPVRDARRAARGNAQRGNAARTRVEHRADGARQRAAFEHGERRAQFAAAAEEARAIGFVLGEPTDHGLRPPRDARPRAPAHRARGAGASASRAVLARQEFGAHEHLRERRVRDGRRRESPSTSSA